MCCHYITKTKRCFFKVHLQNVAPKGENHAKRHQRPIHSGGYTNCNIKSYSTVMTLVRAVVDFSNHNRSPAFFDSKTWIG